MNSRIDEFASIKSIKFINDILIPKLEDFSDQFDFYKADNIEMRGCLKNLDKSLCIKSNKAEMSLLKAELFSNFIGKD